MNANLWKNSDFLFLLKFYLKDTITQKQITDINNYLILLEKWNKIYNLTAIFDKKSIVIKHVLDSLSVNDFLLGDNIIDVGTGAGFPGIILAIINENKSFTLIDSVGKKIKFLQSVKNHLNLNNVVIAHSRAEDYKPCICFNTIITRAFSSIKKMLTLTTHFCCKNGIFIAMKGRYPEDELKDIGSDFKILSFHKIKLPDLDDARHIIILQRH